MNQDDNTPAAPVTPPGGEGVEPAKLTVPFEDESKDFFTGLIETIKLVIFQPSHFFRNYKFDGSIGRPMLFAVMIGWTMAVIGAIWGTIINKSLFVFIQDFLQEHMPQIEGVDWDQIGSGGSSLDFILTLIFAPIGIMLGLFILSGLYHLFLLMTKGAGKNFETTFNVVAYGAVVHLAEIIPFCGGLISWLWGIILAIIGLTEAHQTDSWKAVFAVFGPIILCCVCCVLFVMAMGGSGFLSEFTQRLG